MAPPGITGTEAIDIRANPIVRALLLATNCGLLIADQEGAGWICNRGFEHLFGAGRETISGYSRAEMRRFFLIRVQDRKRFTGLMARIISDPGVEWEGEITLLPPWERTLRCHTAPLRGEQGRLLGRLWTFMETAKEPEPPQNIALWKAAGSVAVGVAHDLRNILTAWRLEIDAENEDAIRAAGRQMDRLYALTDWLLALADEESIVLEPVNLAEIVDRSFRLAYGQAAVNQTELKRRIAGNVPTVRGDARRLEHLFVHLLLFSLHSLTATGGSIMISVRKANRGVMTRVRDTGPGIPGEQRRHILDPMVISRTDYVNQGLSRFGLYGARRIVEAHQGTIQVRSTPGHGACVSLWLPAVDEKVSLSPGTEGEE